MSKKDRSDPRKDMIEESVFRSIRQRVEATVRGDSTGHDIQHTMRVHDMCVKIGTMERADIPVLRASALLHDIAITSEVTSGIDHAKEGARLAESILRSLGFAEAQIACVVYAISVHRYGAGMIPETLEAKILQDADRLDAIGAIGLARAFSYGGARGASIHDPEERPGKYDPMFVRSTITHVQEKLLRLGEGIHTAEARRLAEGRHAFMLEFLRRFRAEIVGDE